MTIKLQNFTATIDIDTVELVGVYDIVKNKTANVDILINNQFGTTLQDFEYSTSWDDSEVLEWANEELNKHVVK